VTPSLRQRAGAEAIHPYAKELDVLQNRARGRGWGRVGFADPDVPIERSQRLGLLGDDHS
jgi:hypothetical protein